MSRRVALGSLGSGMLLALLLAALVLLAVGSYRPVALDDARILLSGRPLLSAIVQRAEAGVLPLGPATPPMYALARAARPVAAAEPGLAAAQVAIEETLSRASARLSAKPSAANTGYRRLAGIALGAQGLYVEAENELKQALAADAADPFAQLALGNVLDEQALRPEALAVWQQAGAIRPLSWQLYREGVRQASQGARGLAERMLLLATQIDPAYADPYHALGGFYWGRDDAKSAEMYRASLAAGGLEPFFERLARGKLALLDNRFDEAAAELGQALLLRPDHSETSQLLGATLRRAGRTAEAIDLLAQAADSSPTAYWPLLQLGQIYLDQNNPAQAVDSLIKAIERRADQPLAFALLAQAYAGADQLEQAVAAWQQAIILDPKNAGYHARLGDVWQQLGQKEQAIAAYQAALQIDPSNGNAQRQLQRLGVAPTSSP